MLVVYLLIAGVYLAHGWGHQLSSLEGDELIYLFTAEHFSPWTSHSGVAMHYAINSPNPPLFPFVLGLLGGGSSFFVANILVAIFMVLGIGAFFLWMCAEGVTEWRAFIVAFLFAILPGTYMHALFVFSEGLYLILSMACLIAVAEAEKSKDERWLFAAAVCVAAALLTRSAGFALLAAFAVYLIWHRRRNIWSLLSVAALPAIVWSLYKKMLGTTEGPSYIGMFRDWYLENPLWHSSNPFVILLNQVNSESLRLWNGLVADFATTTVSAAAFVVIGILFLSAVTYRMYLRKFDGLYVALYVAMILVWPFSYAANAEKRFAFLVIPVLMYQGLFLLGHLARLFPKYLRFNPAEAIYLIAILLLALPSLALATGRYLQPLPPELEPYRRVGWWYKWYWHDNLESDPQWMYYAKLLAEGLPKVAKGVPENECVFSVKPFIVGTYMRRINKFPPRETLGDVDFLEAIDAKGCRYFFFMNDVSPSYSEERFFPAQRLGDRVELISALAYRPDDNSAKVGVLGKLK